MPNRYLETELRIIDRTSDKINLCKWNVKDEWPKTNEAVICAISLFPETKTLVFKANPLNPAAIENTKIPILLRDDPEILLDKSTKQKPGYSSIIIIHNLL